MDLKLPSKYPLKGKSQHGSSAEHKKLKNDILVALSKIPGVVVWPQETGVARSMDGERVIKFGLVGSADITGILRGGTRLEVECKTGNATQSVEQKNFERMINRNQGLYIVARSVLDATNAVTDRLASNPRL